jgi:hypothetical protein
MLLAKQQGLADFLRCPHAIAASLVLFFLAGSHAAACTRCASVRKLGQFQQLADLTVAEAHALAVQAVRLPPLQPPLLSHLVAECGM